MNYRQRLEEQQRAYESHMLWADVVMLLSMDLTSYFVDELGIAEVYSSDLRKVARGILADINDESEFTEWVAALHKAVPEQFLDQVATYCGSDIAHVLQNWSSKVFVSDNQSSAFDYWNDTIARLVNIWDKEGLNDGIPFAQVEETRIRIKLRDYIRHIRDVSNEIYLTAYSTRSEWDESMNLIHDHVPEYSITLVLTACDNYLASVFWESLLSELNDYQKDKLVLWARKNPGSALCKFDPVVLPF